MLYSPTQEVPATPVLMRSRPVWSHGFGTPVATNLNDFAVVPDDSAVVPDFLEQTQDLSGIVPRTPAISGGHQEFQPSGPTRYTRVETLRNTSTQPNTPRLLPSSPSAGLRSGQEQIVPGTPVGGFIRCNNTPKSGWSTPDTAVSDSSQANTPTSRPFNNRRKYIRTSKLCFGPSTSTTLPKDNNQMDMSSDNAKKVDHVVDATGDNRILSKKHDSSAMENSNANNVTRINETKSSSDSNPDVLQESSDIKDFLDMI